VTEIIKVISLQIAGVQIWPLQNNPDGTFDLDEMEEKVRNHTDDHEPMTSLICVENTQNWCGGRVLPLEWLDDVSIVGNDFNKNIFESPSAPVIVQVSRNGRYTFPVTLFNTKNFETEISRGNGLCLQHGIN
jgi:hypothetical protein